MFSPFQQQLVHHWRSQQKKPRHKTTTDFFTAMNAEHHRYAIRAIHAASQALKPLRELAVFEPADFGFIRDIRDIRG